MKIRLNNNYTAELMPGSRKFVVELEVGRRYFDNVPDLVEAVAMDIISKQEGIITLAEYQVLFKQTNDDLINGVIDIGVDDYD